MFRSTFLPVFLIHELLFNFVISTYIISLPLKEKMRLNLKENYFKVVDNQDFWGV